MKQFHTDAAWRWNARMYIHSTLPVRPQFIFPNSPDKIQLEVGGSALSKNRACAFSKPHIHYSKYSREECGSYWEKWLGPNGSGIRVLLGIGSYQERSYRESWVYTMKSELPFYIPRNTKEYPGVSRSRLTPCLVQLERKSPAFHLESRWRRHSWHLFRVVP